MKKYQIIYADPPWQYSDELVPGGAGNEYKTLSLKDILALRVPDLVDENAHLYLWVTNPFLQEGLEVVKAWGFKYMQMITWVKMSKAGTPAMGLGYYFRGCTEQVLFGVRGKLPKLTSSLKNVLFSTRGKHSEKPREFRDIIVQHSGDLPRVELFARTKVAGWDAWGNEIEGSSEIEKILNPQ